ncbi:MAG: hypothetical protein CVU11_04820 [Bacteroidetes bacterium HGW-Bacteroidetes-6]|jgi:hypothetical protein|nr:MAG: hypothetical protein CVU11_04820 [Bacteroidetes bacterium HGW-Bacteroidetes-6]
MHTPLTAPVGSLLFIAGLGHDGPFLRTLGVLMILFPEGISCDICLNDKMEISPFIDVNSCEFFVHNTDNTLGFLLSGDIGLTAQMYIGDKLYTSAHA